MIGAVLDEHGVVVNTIVMDESQIEELSQNLGQEIVDSRPYGLQIGDVRRQDGVWVRNANGDNLILEKQETRDFSSYALITQENERLKIQVEKSEAEKATLTKQLNAYKVQLQKAGVKLESI